MIVNNNKIKKDLLVKAYQLKNQGKSKSEVRNILKSNFILPTKIYNFHEKPLPNEDIYEDLGLPLLFENNYQYTTFNFDGTDTNWLFDILKQTKKSDFSKLIKEVTDEITNFYISKEEFIGSDDIDEDELADYNYAMKQPSIVYWLNVSDLSIVDYGNNIYAIHIVLGNGNTKHDLAQYNTAYELKSKYPNIIFFIHYKRKPNQYIRHTDLGIDKSIKQALLYRKFYSDHGYHGKFEEELETNNINITIENSQGVDVYEPSEPYKPSSWWELFKRFFFMNRR